MKTLDEVISTMEYEQAYNAGEARDYDADALHYLKEYRAILPLVPSLINTAIEVQKKGKTIG